MKVILIPLSIILIYEFILLGLLIKAFLSESDGIFYVIPVIIVAAFCYIFTIPAFFDDDLDM